MIYTREEGGEIPYYMKFKRYIIQGEFVSFNVNLISVD